MSPAGARSGGSSSALRRSGASSSALRRSGAAPLTAEAPFLRRFGAWASDRFPPAVCLLFTLMFVTSAFVAAVSVGASPTLSIGPVLGALAFVAFYFGLRVYDEHKDLDVDRAVHPERLTVTGVLPLADLRRVQALGLAFQAVVCVVVDRGVGAVTVTWLAATAWSVLMLKEFFVPAWLSQRLVVYTLSHQIVVPLTVLWAASFGAGRFVWNAAIAWLCVVVTASALTFELARKMHAPADERPGVDSYTRTIGATAAPLVALAVMALGTAGLVALTGTLLNGPAWVAWSPATALLIVTGVPLARFAIAPTSELAAKLQTVVALYLLGTYLILLATLIAQRGLTWN